MIRIDSTACKACGICGHLCPRHVLETVTINDEKRTQVVKERLDLCMGCGQCAAVCPDGAIRVDGLDWEKFKSLRPLEIGYKQLMTLMENRRSVRRYKNKPVPRDVLDRIAEAVRYAPTGTGRPTTGMIIIDNPEKLQALAGLLHDFYEDLGKKLQNPLIRYMIKRRAGEKALYTLQNFVMPGMHWYNRWYREGTSDEITRNCPVLMLFHTPTFEPSGDENCIIAAVYAIYTAQVLGVGTCFNTLIPQACNRSDEVRRLIGLAEDREVHGSLTMGYPKYKFARTISRGLAEVRYLD